MPQSPDSVAVTRRAGEILTRAQPFHREHPIAGFATGAFRMAQFHRISPDEHVHRRSIARSAQPGFSSQFFSKCLAYRTQPYYTSHLALQRHQMWW